MAKGDHIARVMVADRAVLAYLAQVWGVDVAGLRRRIAREAATGLDHGAVACNRGGAKYVLSADADGPVVATVTARRALPHPQARRPSRIPRDGG